MKILISAILYLIFSPSFGQTFNDFPKGENGVITYVGVEKADSISRQELHSRAKLFFAETFVSANDVVQMDDKESGIVLGKGLSTISIKSGKYEFPVNLKYTIKVECKDNRYKWTITNIIYSSKLADFPAETFFNTETDNKYAKAKKHPKEIMQQYRDKTLETINRIKTALLVSMNNRKNSSW